MLSEPAWVFPYCCIFFYFILISISNSFILKWCQLSSPVLTCLCLHRLLLKMNETSIKTLQCLQFVSSYRSFIQYSAIQYITMLSIVVFPVNRAVTAASVSVPSIQGNGCIFYVSKTQNISCFCCCCFFPHLKTWSLLRWSEYQMNEIYTQVQLYRWSLC